MKRHAIQFPDEMWEALARIAQKHHTSTSGMVRRIILESDYYLHDRNEQEREAKNENQR